jgi:hypothetical protein
MRTSSITYYKAIKRFLKHIVVGTVLGPDLRLKLWLKSNQLGLIDQASLKLWESDIT